MVKWKIKENIKKLINYKLKINKKDINGKKKINNTWKVQNWIKNGGFKMITDKKE